MPITDFVRVAVEGDTIDGRQIDRQHLLDMAETYDADLFTAVINTEHIRGATGDKPFQSLGHVIAVKTQEDEFNIAGKTVKKLAFYAKQFINDAGVELKKKGQKLFSSIEIKQDVLGTGKSYLSGLAHTDSPASFGTAMLKFSQSNTKSLFSTAVEMDLGNIEADVTNDDGKSFLKSLTGVLEGFATKFGAPKTDDKPEPKADDKPAAFTADDIKGLFTAFGTETQKALTAIAEAGRAEIDTLAAKFTALEAKIEGTPSKDHSSRPLANGGGNFAKTDC